MLPSFKLLAWLAAAAVMMVPAASPVGLAAQESPAPSSAADLAAAGAALYARNCAACHGGNLAPAEPIFDLRDLARSDRQRFVNSVTRGKDSMPAWGALLAPQQIEALWEFIMSRNSSASSAAFAAAAAPAAAAVAPSQVPAAPAAAASPSQAWPCGGDANLLVDSAGAPVWIASDELLSRAVDGPPLAPAAANGAMGRLTIDVLIDSQGRVKCTRAAPGSIAAPPATLEAISKWTFRPFAAGGQPVAVFGRLQLTLEAQ